MRFPVTLAVLATSVVSAGAQTPGPTLREMVDAAHQDVSITISTESPPLSVGDMIRQTDLVVRATVGTRRSYLTEDGRDIFTAYELLSPQVLFPAGVGAARPGVTPPAPIVLNQPGGEVAFGALKATVRYDIAGELPPGSDVIALLSKEGQRYFAAGRAGLFRVQDSRVSLVNLRRGEHQRYEGVSVDSLVAEILALKK